MDYIKIGNFILNKRKEKKLTQAKLAEKLFVSEKTISKWENGKSLPDTEILPKLCSILGVNVNELLNGEIIEKNNYEIKAERKLVELQMANEEHVKRLLSMEIVIAILSISILISLILIPIFISMQDWLRFTLIGIGTILFIFGMLAAIRIEQVAGYYKCKKCGHKFVPTFNQVNLAMHLSRSRYLKCPECNKKSWCKKVVK